MTRKPTPEIVIKFDLRDLQDYMNTLRPGWGDRLENYLLDYRGGIDNDTVYPLNLTHIADDFREDLAAVWQAFDIPAQFTEIQVETNW